MQNYIAELEQQSTLFHASTNALLLLKNTVVLVDG